MTTRIYVDAHAGWPVKVTALDKQPDGSVKEFDLGTVPPNKNQDFHVWDTRSLRIEELSRPPANESAK